VSTPDLSRTKPTCLAMFAPASAGGAIATWPGLPTRETRISPPRSRVRRYCSETSRPIVRSWCISTLPPAMSPPRTNGTSPSWPGFTTPYVIGVSFSVKSFSGMAAHLVASLSIAQPLQIGLDRLLQLRRLRPQVPLHAAPPCATNCWRTNRARSVRSICHGVMYFTLSATQTLGIFTRLTEFSGFSCEMTVWPPASA